MTPSEIQDNFVRVQGYWCVRASLIFMENLSNMHISHICLAKAFYTKPEKEKDFKQPWILKLTEILRINSNIIFNLYGIGS